MGIASLFDTLYRAAVGAVVGAIAFTGALFGGTPSAPTPGMSCTSCQLTYEQGCTDLGEGEIPNTNYPGAVHDVQSCNEYCSANGANFCFYGEYGDCHAYRSGMYALRRCQSGNWSAYCTPSTQCTGTPPPTTDPVGVTTPTPGGTGGTPNPASTSTCTTAPAYSCSGNTIMRTDSSCTSSPVTTCVAPAYCSPGSAVCLSAKMAFIPFEATLTTTPSSTGVPMTSTIDLNGHLWASPALVRKGETSHLFWKVANAASCTVSSPSLPDFVVSALTSGASGKLTPAINQQTTFTLHCIGASRAPNDTLTESVVVSVIPRWQEN